MFSNISAATSLQLNSVGLHLKTNIGLACKGWLNRVYVLAEYRVNIECLLLTVAIVVVFKDLPQCDQDHKDKAVHSEPFFPFKGIAASALKPPGQIKIPTAELWSGVGFAPHMEAHNFHWNITKLSTPFAYISREFLNTELEYPTIVAILIENMSMAISPQRLWRHHVRS